MRKTPLFSSLTDAQCDRVLDEAELISLNKGDVIFSQGQDATRFYLIVSGRVRMLKTLPNRSERLIELFGEGQTFAEALMFLGKPQYPLSAQADCAAEVIGFSNEPYRDILSDNSALCLGLLGELSVRLKHRLRDIEMLSLRNSSMRVARYLISLYSPDADESDVVVLPFSKRMLATHLAIQPETLSRILQRMRDDKIVAVDGNRITIIDLDALYLFE